MKEFSMFNLVIEASNQSLSVALFQDGKVVSNVHLEKTLQHSIHLAPAVEEVMTNGQCTYAQLENVVVSNGPGSYTGLRIGITFAKTLGQTLNIPIIPVSSLQMLSESVANYGDKIVVPFYDARRQNVYVGYYADGKSVYADEHVAMSTVLDKLSNQSKEIVFISPDIQIFKESIIEKFPSATLIERYPNACDMQRFLTFPHQHYHEVLPSYLKLAEAEETWENVSGLRATNDLVERRNDK